MINLPIPSAETIKRWIDYWRRFKGKRVKIFLKSGIKANIDVGSDFGLSKSKTSLEHQFSETLIGTIEDVVENPFGIWLKDVSIPEEKEAQGAFIPMSEITRMYSLKEKTEGTTS
jgi:hypothetical protein